MTPSRPDEAEDSVPPRERRERRFLHIHRLCFVGAFLPAFFGGFLGRTGAVIGFSAAAVCWGASGVCAILAKRHMFGDGGGGGFMGNFVRVRASSRSPVGATIVGVVLIVLALGLANAAVQMALAAR